MPEPAEKIDLPASRGRAIAKAIMPVHYLGTVSYYAAMLGSGEVVFEVHEHFIKQTHRNRCAICGPNGRQDIIIPIKRSGQRTAVKDAQICNDHPWQKIHWRSFEAAYRSSGFFEYYEDVFAPFFQREYDFLTDYCLRLHKVACNILQIDIPSSATNTYEKKPADALDLRNSFPVCTASASIPRYRQVFESRHAFIPHLSVIDLIFNLGPKAGDYLYALAGPIATA